MVLLLLLVPALALEVMNFTTTRDVVGAYVGTSGIVGIFVTAMALVFALTDFAAILNADSLFQNALEGARKSADEWVLQILSAALIIATTMINLGTSYMDFRAKAMAHPQEIIRAVGAPMLTWLPAAMAAMLLLARIAIIHALRSEGGLQGLMREMSHQALEGARAFGHKKPKRSARRTRRAQVGSPRQPAQPTRRKPAATPPPPPPPPPAPENGDDIPEGQETFLPFDF